MVGAGHVITKGHRARLAHEDRTRAPQRGERGRPDRLRHHEQQVFRRPFIGERHAVGDGAHRHDRPTRGERLAHDRRPRCLGDLGEGFDFERVGERRDLFRRAHQHRDHRGVGVVFGLCHQLAGERGRVGSVVGQDQQFARARRRIDRHIGHQLQLGFGHERVARSHDAIHPRHGRGADRHGSDRSRSAQGEDPIHAGQGRRRQHDGRRKSVGTRRRTDDHLTHPSHPGRDRAHQERARIGGPSARSVDPHAAERIGAPSHANTGFRRALGGYRAEGLVHGGNVPGRPLEYAAKLRIERGQCGVPGRPRDFDGRQFDPIEIPGEGHERGIAFLANPSDNRHRSATNGRVGGRGAVYDGQAGLGIERGQRAARPQPKRSGGGHGTSLSMRVTRIPSPPSARSCEIVR